MKNINVITDDLNITADEIRDILSKVTKAEGKDIFNLKLRTKEKQSIMHSTFVTARTNIRECNNCLGTGTTDYGDYLCNKCICGLKSDLIGFVRIIGDSTYEYYISEVMVLPEYQNKGIGSKMMKASLEYCKKNGFMQIVLTAAKGREKYYRKFGFKNAKYTVMKIKNNG